MFYDNNLIPKGNIMQTYSLNSHDEVLYKNNKELTATTLEDLEKECLDIFSQEEMDWLWVIFEFEGDLYTMYPDSGTFKVKALNNFPDTWELVKNKIANKEFN